MNKNLTDWVRSVSVIPLLVVVTTLTVDAQNPPEPAYRPHNDVRQLHVGAFDIGARLELPIVLIDSIGRPQEAVATLRGELERLLEPAGIQPVWLTPGTADPGPFVGRRPFAVKVILRSSAPHVPRLPGGVLAMVLASVAPGRQGDTMFLVWPAIVRQLRRSSGTLSSAREEGRALARLVFHELAHLLVPHREHAAGGLMAPGVERRLLVREALAVAPDWLRDVREGLLRALEQRG